MFRVIFKIVTVILLGFVLTGCKIYWQDKLFSEEEGVVLFDTPMGFLRKKNPLEVAAVFREDFFALALPSGNSHVVKYKGTKIINVTVVPLKSHSNIYIAQAGPWDGGYRQLLIRFNEGGWFSKRKFSVLTIDRKKVRVDPRFKDLPSGWYKVPSKEALVDLYDFAVSNNYYREKEYQSFDTSKDAEKALFAELIAGTENSEWLDGGVTSDTSNSSAVFEGAWAFQGGLDVMTDKKSPVILGLAVEYSGTPKAPVARFYCGENSRLPYIELLWGTRVAPMDRTADVQIVVVDMRLDKQESLRTIWIPSNDYSMTWEVSDAAKPLLQASVSALSLFDPSMKNATASWTSAKLAALMSVSSRLTVQANGYSGTKVTAVFDLNGFARAFHRFEERCN